MLCSGTHAYSSLSLPDSDDTGYDEEKVSRWYRGSTCSRFRDVFVGSRALFPPCQPNLPPGVPTWGEFPFTVSQPTTLHAYLGKVSSWTSTFRQPHSHLETNHALNILLRSSKHVTQSNVSNSLSQRLKEKEKRKKRRRKKKKERRRKRKKKKKKKRKKRKKKKKKSGKKAIVLISF